MIDRTVHIAAHGYMVKLRYTKTQGDIFTDSGIASLHHAAMETAILSQSDHRVAVGARLRKVIDLLGMPYTEAAELMGVSKQVLRNWMAGEHYPSPYSIYRLCRTRGIDFDYVFLGNWDGLPHHLARALDAELEVQLAPPAQRPEEGKVSGPLGDVDA